MAPTGVEHKLLLKHDPSELRFSIHQSGELISQAEEMHFSPAVGEEKEYRYQLYNQIWPAIICAMLWSRSSNCQGRDDMTKSVVEPSSRISLPTMTNELRASRKRGRPSRFSFASCKCSRLSHQILDPTAVVGHSPHNRSSKATSSHALSRGQTFQVLHPPCRSAQWAGGWPLCMA